MKIISPKSARPFECYTLVTKYQGVYQSGLWGALSSLGSSEKALLFLSDQWRSKNWIIEWEKWFKNLNVGGKQLEFIFSCQSKDTIGVVVVGGVSCALFAQKKLMAKNTMKIHFYSVKKVVCQQHPVFPGQKPTTEKKFIGSFQNKTPENFFKMEHLQNSRSISHKTPGGF